MDYIRVWRQIETNQLKCISVPETSNWSSSWRVRCISVILDQRQYFEWFKTLMYVSKTKHETCNPYTLYIFVNTSSNGNTFIVCAKKTLQSQFAEYSIRTRHLRQAAWKLVDLIRFESQGFWNLQMVLLYSRHAKTLETKELKKPHKGQGRSLLRKFYFYSQHKDIVLSHLFRFSVLHASLKSHTIAICFVKQINFNSSSHLRK